MPLNKETKPNRPEMMTQVSYNRYGFLVPYPTEYSKVSFRKWEAVLLQNIANYSDFKFPNFES